MNSLMLVIMIIAGAVLMYAAVTGQDPRELVKRSLQKGGE